MIIIQAQRFAHTYTKYSQSFLGYFPVE